MLKTLFIFAIFLPSFQIFAEQLFGEARSKGVLLYTEKHDVIEFKGMIKKINSDYFKDDKKIGFRQIDFPENHYVPNLVFKDEKFNDTYSVTVNGLRGVLKSYIDKIEKTTEFTILDNMVVTDSISKYIYDNYNALMTETRVLKCLLPRSHRFIDLVVKKEKSKNGDETTFSIQPKSSILKLFTTKSYIVYDNKTKLWKKYIGFSNLKNKKGKIVLVEIKYARS